MDARLRELERAAGTGDAAATAALLDAWRRAGRCAVDVDLLARAGVSLAFVPGGEYPIGHGAVVLHRPPQHGRLTARVAAPARVALGGFFIAKEPLRLGGWTALRDALTPARWEAARAAAQTRTVSYLPDLRLTTPPTAGERQADRDARWHELSRQWEPDPPIELTHADAARVAAALGGALPEADEWEAATRGPDGRLYPWGDALDAGELSIDVRDYSIDDESVMGHYSYDQEVSLVYSFGAHARQPSPFGLLGLARAGREWNVDGATGAPLLRSLSDLGDMASMIPGIRPGTWDASDEFPPALAFSGPSLPCWTTPAPPFTEAALRLVLR